MGTEEKTAVPTYTYCPPVKWYTLWPPWLYCTTSKNRVRDIIWDTRTTSNGNVQHNDLQFLPIDQIRVVQ